MIKFRSTFSANEFQYLSQFALIVLCLFIIFFMVPVSETTPSESSLFNDFFQSALRPERGEASAFFILIAGSCSAFTVLALMKKNADFSLPEKTIPALCLLLTGMCLYIFKFEPASILLPENLQTFFFGILLCLSLIWSFVDRIWFHLILRYLFIGCLLFLIFKLRIYHFEDVVDSGQWTNHFQTFFYPIGLFTQDRFDFNLYKPQYGFSGFYLSRLLTPGSDPVLRITAGYAVIYAISLFLIFERTRIFLSHQLTRTLLIASLIFLTGHHFLALRDGTVDPYLQYFPLRFVGPVHGMLMVFILKMSFKLRVKILLLSVISGLIVTWNLDSGLPVVLSFTVIMMLHSFRQGLFYILLSSVFILVLYTLMGISLLQLIDLFKFQRIWVEMGFGMQPAPREPHLWHLIAGIYVFTLFLNLGRAKFKAHLYDLSVFLSLTGLQTFAYYAGKSDDTSLIDVSWPAVVIVFLYLDRFMEKNPLRWEKFLVFLLPSLFGAQLLVHSPQLLDMGKIKIQTDRTMFLKAADEQCEIVSGHAGIYRHYFPDLVSWNGPSLSELPLQQDYEKYLSFLRTKSCLFIEPQSLNSNFRGGKAILSDLRKENFVSEESFMGENFWIKARWTK